MRSLIVLHRFLDCWHMNACGLLKFPHIMIQSNRKYGAYVRGFQSSLLIKHKAKYGVAFYCENHQDENDAKSAYERLGLQEWYPTPLVTVTEMTKFFTTHNLPYTEGFTSFILNCPICLQTRQDEYSSCGKLHVNKITGRFICYSCKTAGAWSIFQDFVCMLKVSKDFRKPSTGQDVFPSADMLEKVHKTFENLTPVVELEEKEFQRIVRRFKMRAISPQCFEKFDVRISDDMLSLFFPIHGPDKDLVALKILHVPPGKNEKPKAEEMTLFPRDVVIGLFGLSRFLLDGQQEIILTSSPMDAMAAYQETGMPTVALPKGITHLPPEILPMFEQFSKITVWFANVLHEWESGKAFARKLNESRCYFIRPQEDHPRPLIALQKDMHLNRILKEAQPITHKSITTFKTLRNDVLAELKHVDQVAGVRWKRYTAFNKLLKGHRRGELTIFTGPTGAGKTTFMSEYSLDLCMQGVSTLWGSFEIKNTRLAKVMLTQFAQLPLDKNLDQFDQWADKFELLPLYFMTFHGEQSPHHVLDAMSHAVYVNDIIHVVVDNVNFMLGASKDYSHLDRFWKQDLMVADFRKFATKHNCHVTLVMHPRKQKDDDQLNNSSVFGGAKAVQEADNVLILQEKKFSVLRNQKYIQITKNRYAGELGIIPLEFNRETYSLVARKKGHKLSVSSSSISLLNDPENRCDR